MPTMPLVAPLFIEDSNFSSLITMVDDLDKPLDVAVVLYSLSGDEIARASVHFPPHSQQVVRVGELLRERNSPATIGSVLIFPQSSSPALAAQLSMIQRDGSKYLEEEFLMLREVGSNVFRALVSGSRRVPVLALKSLSSSRQTVSVSCLIEGEAKVLSSVVVESQQTYILPACKKRVSSSMSDILEGWDDEDGLDVHTGKVIAVSVSATSKPGDFAVYGIGFRGTHDSPSFMPLQFVQTSSSRSTATVYAGVPVGPAEQAGFAAFQPEIGVANYSGIATKVTVRYASSAAPEADGRVVAVTTVPPEAAASISLPHLSGDGFMRNSFVVESDLRAGEFYSTLRAVSTSTQQVIELVGKDRRQLDNGGEHPWTTASGIRSTLILFNPAATSAPVDIKIQGGTSRWSQARRLDPSETAVISINSIIENTTKDSRGVVISKTVTEGLVNWFSTSPGSVFGRLIQTEPSRGLARSFSCGTTQVICGANISPDNISIDVGYDNGTSVDVIVCYADDPTLCTGISPNSGQAQTYQWATGNPNIAALSDSGTGSGERFNGIGAGTTGIGCSVRDGYGCSAQPVAQANVLCAVPINFRQTASSCISSTGVLSFTFTWDSSTGDRSHLAGCTIREVVRYDNNGTPPSPPFPNWSFTNPTIVPGSATSAFFTDNHSPPNGSFVRPYSESTFNASQDYDYRCSCQGTSDYTIFNGFRGITIARQVTNPSGTWIYRITKSGTSCSLNLPQP